MQMKSAFYCYLLIALTAPASAKELLAQITEAAFDGNLAEITRLVQNPLVNGAQLDRSSALHLAAKNNHVPMAGILLAKGADPNLAAVIPDLAYSRQWHFTPLQIAAKKGNIEVARTLLAAGADPNRIVDGRAAIHVAAGAGKVPFTLLLILEYGVDANILDANGDSPMTWALRGGPRTEP